MGGLKSLRRSVVGPVLLLALILCPPTAFAGDLDSAKQALEKVKHDVDGKMWDSVEDEIKSTEDFLEGLPAADRDPVQKQLDEYKVKAAAGVKDYKSKIILDKVKRQLDSAAEDMSRDPSGARSVIEEATQLLDTDDGKKYVDPADAAKFKARAASLQTMVVSKTLDRAAPIIKELDDAMAAEPFKDAKSNEDVDHVAQQLGQLKSRVNGALEHVPDADPRKAAIMAKIAGYDKTIAAAAGSAGASQAAEQLAHQWKGQQEYFAGWDAEKASPTWEQYSHTTSSDMDDLLMPKTMELLRRMPSWFEEDSVKSVASEYKDNASVKATMAEAHKAYDTATAKVQGAYSKLLTEAEAAPMPTDDMIRMKAGRLADRADNWFHGTSYHDASVARAKKLDDKWKGTVAAATAGQEAKTDKMTTDAAAAWPKLAADIKAEDGFTPDKLDQYKGKVIHLKANNRLGYEFEPGGYAFAMKINGMPVAGKYNPAVAKAVDEAVKATGHDLPDESWDVYAVVEGPGKISQRTSSEGDMKVDGSKVGTYTAEGHHDVDCTVVKIFALHAGPVAVASAPDGSSGGFSIIKLLEHLIEFGICVAAAGLVVLKGKPALIAQAAGGSTVAKIPSAGVAMAGLGCAALGVLWLLSKLILGDLLPAGCLTLAGIYASTDWLQAKKLLPAKIVASLHPLALPIAGATVLFGLLHLFLADQWLF